jgi:iron(III) transport system substrate-binding protein
MLWKGLLSAVAVACFVAAPTLAQSEQELYEAAKKEGEVTWYIAHYSAETAEAVGHAFTEKYPGVKVNVVRSTAQVAMQRLMQDLQNNAANCDVFSSTDVGHYVHLKKEKKLLKYVPKNASTVFKDFQNIDPDGYYHTTSAGMVLITYNKELVSEAEAPKNWTDLVDPNWKGKVSVGHPAFSGYVGTWVVTMRKLYGWDYFEKLANNAPHTGRTINYTVTMLQAKERAVAAGPDATTAKAASRGAPLGLIYPTDGALLMISPSAIPINAPHPNAAKLLMEFLLSPGHSKVAVEYYGLSLHSSVKGQPDMKSVEEVKTIRPTIEEIAKGIPEVIEDWRDTFGS